MKTRDGDGNLRDVVDPAEQDALAKKFEQKMGQISRARESRQIPEERIQEDLAFARMSWQRRLDLLAAKRKLMESGKTEDDPEVTKINNFIGDTQIMLFSAFCDERLVYDYEAFYLWLQSLIREDKEIERAFRYTVELARRLKVLEPASPEDQAMVDAWQGGDQSVPRPYFIIKYNPRLQRKETLMVTDCRNQQMRDIHFELEALRRRAKEISLSRKAEAIIKAVADEGEKVEVEETEVEE